MGKVGGEGLEDVILQAAIGWRTLEPEGSGQHVKKYVGAGICNLR